MFRNCPCLIGYPTAQEQRGEANRRIEGWYGEGHPAGFLMSIVGAMILFLPYPLEDT